MFAHLSVRDVRLAGLIVLLLALLVGFGFAMPLLRDFASKEEPVRIAARYGPSLVDVDTLSLPDRVTVVELSSFDGLMRVARRLECPVLHQIGEVERYAVVDNGTVYEYPVTQARAEAPTRVPDSPAALLVNGSRLAAHRARSTSGS